jgi:hypothetical protein
VLQNLLNSPRGVAKYEEFHKALARYNDAKHRLNVHLELLSL